MHSDSPLITPITDDIVRSRSRPRALSADATTPDPRRRLSLLASLAPPAVGDAHTRRVPLAPEHQLAPEHHSVHELPPIHNPPGLTLAYT